MRKLLKGIVLLSILSSFCCQFTSLAGESAPPNILFILTDDQGWSQRSDLMDPDVADSFSVYLNTPNMNSLAVDGMRFTSGYSPAPLCTPTRRSILCGTSAARSGTEFASPWVPADHMTIPRALKSANPEYQTAHFGKWGEQMISTPEECGYDLSDGMTGNVTGGMEDKMKPHFLVKDPKRTGTVTQRAIEFMKEQVGAGNPFYAQVSYYAVHLRIELLKESLSKYQNKGTPDRAYTHGWAGMLEELDSGIGDLLNAVDEMGIGDNTYVFFMSDNGGRGTLPGGAPKRLPPNHPLAGAKHSLQEGGIRVPFMVKGPQIEAGAICDTPVVGYDLLSTFYNLAGGKGKISAEIDGASFAPLLENPGKRNVERPVDALVFYRPRRGMATIRQGDFKLFITTNKEGKVLSKQLFNLKTDPYEKVDISKKNQKLVGKLDKILNSYLKKVTD